jgi:hypothetical protein
MNDANSRSARFIWSAQAELSNDLSEFMGFSSSFFSMCVRSDRIRHDKRITPDS